MLDNYTRLQELEFRLNWVIAEIDQTAGEYEKALLNNQPKELIDKLNGDIDSLKQKLNWYAQLKRERQSIWSY